MISFYQCIYLSFTHTQITASRDILTKKEAKQENIINVMRPCTCISWPDFNTNTYFALELKKFFMCLFSG